MSALPILTAAPRGLPEAPDPSRVVSPEPRWRAALARLRAQLGRPGRGVVCLSGGVDSALVLAVAAEQRGEEVVALTAVSPTLPEAERRACEELAARAGVRHLQVESQEMQREGFVSNGSDRCYHCKTELYGIARREAARLGFDWIADGVNLDDLGDHRPGLIAATEHGVLHPLILAQMNKADVRGAARSLGLSVWDKPAFACLSSRFPYGTQITEERLDRVGQVEGWLRAQGLRQVRVRSDDRTARIEVLPSEIERLASEPLRGALVAVAKEAGFLWVALDLEGYRMGSLNAGLPS